MKPANLLFDEEGRVRIADFGVARALAEAAWTEPAGAMVGTARYASPEQAEGQQRRRPGRRLLAGLVLYESVTGEVPFVADTTMGTLMARVGAPLPRHPGPRPARRRAGPGGRPRRRATGSTPPAWRRGWRRWPRPAAAGPPARCGSRQRPSEPTLAAGTFAARVRWRGAT